MLTYHNSYKQLELFNKRFVSAGPDKAPEIGTTAPDKEKAATDVVTDDLNNKLRNASEGKKFRLELDYGKTTGVAGLMKGDHWMNDKTNVVGFTWGNESY